MAISVVMAIIINIIILISLKVFDKIKTDNNNINKK